MHACTYILIPVHGSCGKVCHRRWAGCRKGFSGKSSGGTCAPRWPSKSELGSGGTTWLLDADGAAATHTLRPIR